MNVRLSLITLADGDARSAEEVASELRKAVARLGWVQSVWVAITVRNVALNAGDLICRIALGDEAAEENARHDAELAEAFRQALGQAGLVSVTYRPATSRARQGGSGFWRVLVFRTFAGAAPEEIAGLEAGLTAMPGVIPSIRSWALSPIHRTEQEPCFTHVWEQEFDTLEGFTIDYMRHPIHWGHVDAWFDAEYPQYIVDPELIQAVGRIDAPLMDADFPSDRNAA